MTYRPGSLPGGLLGDLILGMASRLDAFSGYPIRTQLLCYATDVTTDILEVRSSRSSRTRDKLPQISITIVEGRGRTVSRRSEPSSRTALIGEQPNPWELLHPQDATSRHRGAEPGRRCELLDLTSLLSPA